MIILLGLLIGFLASVPLGPVSTFAVSRALKHDFLHGLLIGLTASFLDIIYCFIALEGISYTTLILIKLTPLLKFIGALILTIISIRLIHQSKDFNRTKFRQKRVSAYSPPMVVALLLYVSNPSLYAFWLAIAGLVTAHQWLSHGGWRPVVFSLSCGFGSATWYFILTKYVSKYHHQLKPKILRKILTGSAIILIGFALFSLITIFF